MADRRPIYWNGTDLQEMSDAEKTAWIDYMCYLYGASPSVVLTVVGSSGSLAAINDTRMQAGAQSTSTTALPGEGTTAEPSVVTVSYDRVTATYSSVSPVADTGKTHWVYLADSGSTIIAMTLQDMKDTFFYPAINKLVSGTESNTTAGTYTISTGTSLADNTLISSTPVFIDTRANTGAYSSGGIPETLDQPTTITNYYLHRRNAVDPVWANLKTPLYIDGSNDLNQYAEGAFDTLYQNWMREIASEDTSGAYRIAYTMATSGGTTKGTGMVDTRLNGSGAHTTRFVGLDDYRAQEFPNGAAATISTYNLRIAKF